MQGPTLVSVQGVVGTLDFFLSRNASLEVGIGHVENEAVFPSDHYPVRLRLLTLLALTGPNNPLARARFKMGSGVSQQQLQNFADSCVNLLSTPPAAIPDAYHHFVAVMMTAVEADFGPPSTPIPFRGSFCPGLVCHTLRCEHTLVGG